MVASGRWQTTTAAAAATAVTLAALPVAYFAWQRSVQRKERQQALKLLRRVELIVAEVSVRLMHLANQAEDAVANEGREGEETAEPESSSSLNSYYHFDSQGNKLKTKWDSYDVDAELERLEQEEQEQSDSAAAATSASAPAATPSPKKHAPADKKKLLATAGGIEREFEAVLEFLDDIRGDGQVKQLRKAIALKINKEHFARIDHIRQLLAAS
ncbi:hypothetical protein Gpo141_00006510 [Globisporangium polare]